MDIYRSSTTSIGRMRSDVKDGMEHTAVDRSESNLGSAPQSILRMVDKSPQWKLSSHIKPRLTPPDTQTMSALPSWANVETLLPHLFPVLDYLCHDRCVQISPALSSYTE